VQGTTEFPSGITYTRINAYGKNAITVNEELATFLVRNNYCPILVVIRLLFALNASIVSYCIVSYLL